MTTPELSKSAKPLTKDIKQLLTPSRTVSPDPQGL